jgi:hypothetical protein
VEIYREGDTAYMNLDGEWLTLSVSDAGDDMLEGAGILGPNDVLTDTCGWTGDGEVELGGIRAQHWTLEKDNLEACMTDARFESLGDLSGVDGDIYIAEDGWYVLQMDLSFSGRKLDIATEPGETLLVDGRMEYHYAISDINQSLSIGVPEEAVAGGAIPDDVPISDDAEAVNNMFGVITYVSGRAAEELARFYLTELPQEGWTQVGIEQLGEVYMLEFSRSDRTVSVMIEFDDETNKTSVMIAIREEDE